MPSDVKSTTAVSKSTHLTGETSKPAEKFLHKGDFKPLPKQHGNFARISEEVVKSKNEIQSTSELIHDNRAILANCKAIQNSAGHFVDKGGVGNWFEGIKQKAANSFLYKIFKKDVQPAIGIQRNVDNLTLTPFQGAREGEGKLNIRFNTDKNEENLIQAKGTETGAQFTLNVGHLKSPKWYQQLGNWIARKTEWGWTQKWIIMTRPERLQEVFKETTRAAKIAALGITPGERDSFFRNQDVVKFLTDKKPENTQERTDWLSNEIKNLRSIADVSGDYTFTQSQLETLKKAEEAIDKSPDHFFDSDQGGLNSSEKADLEMMVLISHTAKARASQNSPQSASDIDSIILSSPFLVGPDACMRMATMLESMAEEQGRQNKVLEKNINKLEGVGKDINSLSNKEQKSDPAMDRLREKMAQKKLVPEELRKQAQMWREIAEVKGALYRYQGFIPLLAESNYEELVGALKDKLKLAGIDKGDIEASADAIYKGLTAGSADALIAGLRIQMEENAEPAVKSWIDDKTKKLQEHLDKTWNASQFHASNIGDLGVLHSEQTEHFEAKKPLDSITSNTNRLDGIIYESKQLAAALKNPDFDLSKVDHRQLPKISSQDLKLDSEVQKALIAQNEKTIKECEALKGSYKILEDLYKPDGKLHSKVRSIEDKLTGLFKGNPPTAKKSKEILDSAANEIRALREEIASLSPNLAKDHIDHLNSFVDNLDRKAGDLKRLNDDCLSVAQGLAVPSKEFYEKRSPELQEKLKKWQERSSDLGLNDLAMFEEGNKAMNAAVQQRVAHLLADLKSGELAWNKFSLAKDAIRNFGEIQKGGSIQTFMADVAKKMQTAFIYGGFGYLNKDEEAKRQETTTLAQLSKSYQSHQADAPKAVGIQQEFNELVQKTRLEGTLRIFGLPALDDIPKEVLEDNSMAKSDLMRGANVLNGQLRNDGIASSVNRHLDKVAGDNPAKRVEAFIDLMKFIQDSDSNRSEDVLRLVNTLCPPGGGAKSLGEALGIAEKLLTGKELGKARSEIYKSHIENRLDKARSNQALNLMLSNPKNNTQLLEAAAKKMLDLQKLGFDSKKFQKINESQGDNIDEIDRLTENMSRNFAIADLNSLAGMMQDPADTYARLLDPTSAETLAPQIGENPGTISTKCRGMEALYHLAEALSNLQDDPDTTRQFKLTMALDRLVTNATGDTLALVLGQENIGEKIKDAFSPQASDPEQYRSVNKEMNVLEGKKKAHEVDCQNHVTFAEGAKQRFKDNKGDADLEKVSSDPSKKQNALRFANAMVAANSLQDWEVEKDGNKTLTREGQRLKAENQHAQLEKNLSNIQEQKDNLLKYYDTRKLEAHPEMESRERNIEYYKNRFRSLDNPFLSFRRGQMGDYTTDLNSGEYVELNQLYPKLKTNSELKNAVQNEKIFLRETNWQTVGRLTRDGGLQRGLAIAEYFSSIDSAELSKQQIDELKAAYSEFENTRSGLIGKQAELRIKNATRAAILQECLERGMSPADFAKEKFSREFVSDRLEKWGWDAQTYAGRDTQVQRELDLIGGLELDEVTKNWEKEAGELRGALETLQRQYGEAIAAFTGRVADLERKLEAASKAGLESLEDNAANLRRANEVRFIRSELEGITQNCPAKDVFLVASSKVFQGLKKLVADDEVKTQKLDQLFSELNESAQENENPEAFWHRASGAFTKQLEKGYRIVFDTRENEELSSATELLIARDWLDFESIAAGYIDDKLAEGLKSIQDHREKLTEKQNTLGRLGVSDFMPEAFSQDRTWIKNIGKNIPNLTAEIFGKASIGEILPALQKHGGPVGKKLAGDQEIITYLTQAGIIEGYFEARAFAKGNQNELAELDKKIESGISKLENQRPKHKTSSDKEINSLNNALRNGHEKFIKSLRDRHEVVKKELNARSLQDIQTGYANADKIEEAIIRNDWQDDRMENFTEAFVEEEDSKQILQNNEEEVPILPAKQQSFTDVSFDSFPLSDNPRPKINNSDWSRAINKPEDLKDYVHIPSQADGYCLLTSLAATRNQTTTELIADLKQAAQETGETDSLNSELKKAKTAEGIDHNNIANLLNKLGIAFKEVQVNDDNPPEFFISSEVPQNAKLTPNSPVLLFRGGHFDLLVPKEVADSNGLPYDGSQFIKNNAR